MERKGCNVQAATLGECLSMWANTAPHGGLIFVGVENDGKITGCSSMDQSHKNALEHLSEFCPDARWSSKVVKVKNCKGADDYILAYRVNYRSDKVVDISNGTAFIREGDKKLKITPALKRELQISRGEIHYELEAASLIFPDDFDQEEVTRFCGLFSSQRGFKQPKTNIELLELAKLGKRVNGVFRPNLACCLLLATDPTLVVPGARIRIIRYEGLSEKFGDELNSVYSEWVDGPIPKMLDLAKQKISSQIRSYQRLTSSGRLERRAEYPEEAWLEAVVNAIAHRSYNFKTQNIFVKIFDDRLVVESPGGFVPPTTSETIYDTHNPRNPFLMSAMMCLELTFCGYEGTRRMRRAMIEAQLPEPKFIQVEANSYKVNVILQNDLETRKAFSEEEFAARTEGKYDDLTKEERAVVRYLSLNLNITVRIAADIVERSMPTANKILDALVAQNILNPFPKGNPNHLRPKTYSLRENR